MRLKSIKLAGFKSFVDATTVPFPTNMTAIVGPNGCGKSNIIDAVRWVMGESSAKNLRGESMTDVIFNGSTGRQPVGQASIELLFDNTEGKLTGEHAAFTEISIKRKVTREGVSQYYLNGSKCRRRDVTDIFLGTGMGPRSYAIIEQGMISRLIESKPEELRVYLEEAAGISKYKERRRETENRMKRTQENLERLTDIREELNKQLSHLKRQANAAEKYAEYKKDERYNTALLNALNWRDLDLQLQSKNKLVNESEVLIEKSLHDKTSNQSLIESARIALEERQEQFNKVQGKYYASGAEIAKVEQQLKFQKERLVQQDRDLAQLQQELAQTEEQIAVNQQQLEELELVLEESMPQLEMAQESLEQSNTDLDDKEIVMRSWQEEWDRFNNESSSVRQKAELEQSAIQQAESRITQLIERRDRLAREKEELDSQKQVDDSDSLTLEKEELELQLEESIGISETLYADLDGLRTELDTLNAQHSSIKSQVAEKNAVLASLRTLQQAALASDGKDSEEWLKQHGFDSSSLLVDGLVVDSGWEKAVESLLSNLLQARIATRDQIKSADYQGMDHAVALIAQNDGSFVDAKPNTLASCIKGAEALHSWLNTVKLAENEEDAFQNLDSLGEGESIITKQGLWLGRSWLVNNVAHEAQSGMVERKEQILELEQELPKLADNEAALLQDVEVKREKLKSLEVELRENEKQSQLLTQKVGQLASQQSANEAKREQFNLRLKRVQDDMTESALNLEVESEKLEAAREAWQEAMSGLDVFADKKDELIEKRETLQLTLDDARQRAREIQTSVHQLQLEHQQKLSQKQNIQHSLDHAKSFYAQLEQKQANLSQADRVDEDSIADLELTLEGLLEARLQDEDRLALARTELEREAQALRDAESERVTFESKIQEQRSRLEQLRMECQAFEINKASLLEQIVKDEFDLDTLCESLTEEHTESSLQEEIGRLQMRVQRLGPINLAAIDEFQTQSERKEYLDAQHEDLSEALDTLASAIRKIDKETRVRFKETYDQVNEGLQRLFPKIFGGGSAHLELTDDDLLETGVMIIARPPGKKNATIHLLSGGEKALTALALVFAIFELNPAPFCMLDEVDAPLDDANVGRFANMVKEMSSHVQFIYISHNKVSMEKADQLMGVTMHEPGVSRLVSVDVEEAAAMVEA